MDRQESEAFLKENKLKLVQELITMPTEKIAAHFPEKTYIFTFQAVRGKWSIKLGYKDYMPPYDRGIDDALSRTAKLAVQRYKDRNGR